MKGELLITFSLSLSSLVFGDYDCMCNYNVEQAVFPGADSTGQPLGYMYEFDCKPLTQTQQNSDKVYTIQFEKQIGYVPVGQQIRLQTCPGQPSSSDLIPQTTNIPVTTATTTQTTISTTPKPTTITTTGKMTTSSTTPSPTTSTTMPIPTTSTTTSTPVPTTSTTTPIQTTSTTTSLPIPITSTTTPITTTSTTTTTLMPTTSTSTPFPTSSTTTPLPKTSKNTQTLTTSTTMTPKQTTMFQTTQKTTPFVSQAVNVTGTPYQYVGSGYNILKGNPDVMTDPGFLTSHRIFQLTGNLSNVREAVYDKFSICKRTVNTVMMYGSKSYQDELKTLVKPSGSHTSILTDKAFTHTNQFESMRQTLDQSNQVVIYKTTICSYETVKYLSENASLGHYSVTREFAKEVCSLPAMLSSSSIVKYMQFLDNWGTSIVTRVDIGTKLVDRYQATPLQIYQHVQQTDFDLLRQDGPYKGFSSSVSINTHDYPNSKAGMSTIGTHRVIASGSVSHQLPISADLVPIFDALNSAYWKPIANELVEDGICPNNILNVSLPQYAANMKSALQQYPSYQDKQTSNNFSHTLIDRPVIQVPITWPSGTYGLMKATNGCPGDNTRWQEGWRKFDTEDTFSSHNSFSSGIQHYLAGDFQSNDIITRFCVKTSEHSITGGQFDQQWPRGSYCLLKKGSCPSGFSDGYIFWDDEDLTNHNAAGGILPDGTYDKNTKMYFCCRNDGLSSNKLLLPTDHTFVLIKYRQSCQAVLGMSVHEVYVRWDDEDLFNKDKSSGAHPLDDGGSKDHKIHFCVYQKQSGPGLIG